MTRHDDRPRREPGRWFLNHVSDEVVRCVKVVHRQLDREMPTWAGEEDRVLARLFVAHELLAETWQPVSRKGVKTTSYKLAEAMDDVVQVLVDLTGRSADDLSGRREIERRRTRAQGDG
jgi:hypothetical protein